MHSFKETSESGSFNERVECASRMAEQNAEIALASALIRE